MEESTLSSIQRVITQASERFSAWVLRREVQLLSHLKSRRLLSRLARHSARPRKSTCYVLSDTAWRLCLKGRHDESLFAARHAFLSGYRLGMGSPPMGSPEVNHLCKVIADSKSLQAPVLAPREPRHRPLRIAHVQPGLTEGHAPTTVIRTLVAHHDTSALDPYVFVTTPGGITQPVFEEVSRYATVRQLHTRRLVDRPAELLDLLAKDAIDIVVFHTQHCAVTSMVAMRRAAPLMLGFVHGGAIHHSEVDYHLVQGLAGIKALSPELKDRAVPILLGVGKRDEAQDGVTRQLDSFPVNAFRFGTIGNLHKYATESNAQHISKILQRCKDAVWLYAGGIGHADMTLLTRTFESNGVATQTAYLGKLSPGDVARFLSSLDVYINSYPRPGGLAVLEAMSWGLPVISLVDGTERYVKASVSYEYVGVDELTFREEDSEAFVELAVRLTQDSALREHLGQTLAGRYSSEFTPERSTAEIDKVILRLWQEEVG